MPRKLSEVIPDDDTDPADEADLAGDADRIELYPPGHDVRSLGPSDSSDSGSDVAGLPGLDSTSDRQGTGERASVELDDEAELRPDADIEPDRVIEARQAGLGGGLDQAEEGQLGVTDEEIASLDEDEE
jgi:hypothetical protein